MNSRGQTLIQALVAAAISAIVMMAMVTMQYNQQQENRALTEKLASLETQRITNAVLNNSEACGKLVEASNLVSPGDLPFNSAAASPASPKIIKLKGIPSADFKVGQSPSSLSTTLKLAAQTDDPAGIQLLVTSPTEAILQLNFNQRELARPIRNLDFPKISLKTSGPPGATQIDECGINSETTSTAVWTAAPGGYGSGAQMFNVTFKPKLKDSWVHLYLDVPSVGGGGSTSSSCGGGATMNLNVDGTTVATSYAQFTNLAYHATPMSVSYWRKSDTTAEFTITAHMSVAGCVSPAGSSTTQPIVLTATEMKEHK